MADPLSFVVSVIAIATLAENVISKGFKYVKVARNCPSEVRTSLAELNVLCGTLDRLHRLLKREELENDIKCDNETCEGTESNEGASRDVEGSGIDSGAGKLMSKQ